MSTADLNDAVEPLCTIDKLRDELEPIEEELSTIGQDVADINVPAALRRRQTIDAFRESYAGKAIGKIGIYVTPRAVSMWPRDLDSRSWAKLA